MQCSTGGHQPDFLGRTRRTYRVPLVYSTAVPPTIPVYPPPGFHNMSLPNGRLKHPSLCPRAVALLCCAARVLRSADCCVQLYGSTGDGEDLSGRVILRADGQVTRSIEGGLCCCVLFHTMAAVAAGAVGDTPRTKLLLLCTAALYMAGTFDVRAHPLLVCVALFYPVVHDALLFLFP